MAGKRKKKNNEITISEHLSQSTTYIFFIVSTALKSTVTNKAQIAVTSQDQSHFTTATKDLYSYLSQRENEFVDVENGKELSQLVVRA